MNKTFNLLFYGKKKTYGLSEEMKMLGFYLKTLEQKVYNTYHELLRNKIKVTRESPKNKLLGKGEKTRTLIPVFKDHGKEL